MNKSTSSKANKMSNLRKSRNHKQPDPSVVTKSQFLGGKFLPPADPPSVEQNPWNKTTIVKVKSGLTAAWEIKISDLADYLVGQLDSPEADKLTIFKSTSVPLDLKIKNIFAWNMTGKSIALGAYNLIAPHDNQDILCDMVDTRGEEALARVGYRWPLQMQQIVFSNNITKPNKVASIFAPATSDVMIHCNIHWKTSITPTSPYNVLLGITNIQQRTKEISMNTRTSSRRLGDIHDVDKKILSWMPATTLGVVPVALTPAQTTSDAVTVHPPPETVDDNNHEDFHSTQTEIQALREEVDSLRRQVNSTTSICSSTSILDP